MSTGLGFIVTFDSGVVQRKKSWLDFSELVSHGVYTRKLGSGGAVLALAFGQAQ
jgi:hypothetical protein